MRHGLDRPQATQRVFAHFGIEIADAKPGQCMRPGKVPDNVDEQIDRLLLPVSPAEPTIIGTPRRRDASSGPLPPGFAPFDR
jgi:hypothetical protein